MNTETSTDYNGWTNRQTWLVNLWLGEIDFIGQYQALNRKFTKVELNTIIRDWVKASLHYVDGLRSGFGQDMATYTSDPRKINYKELVDHLQNDINNN